MAATQQLSSLERTCNWRQGAVVLVLFAALLAGGCASPEPATQDVITVEGMVTARGNEPFVRYVLETEDHTYYALRIPEADRAEFRTPARLRATGRVYVEDWNGRAFTHMDVSTWQQVD